MGKTLSPPKNPPPTLSLTVTQAAWHWYYLLYDLHNAGWQQVWKPKSQKCTWVQVLETPKWFSTLGDGEGRSTEPLYCCTSHSSDSNSCVLGYLCAHALNSHKAEPHPNSGQPVWGRQSPTGLCKSCDKQLSEGKASSASCHHFLPAEYLSLLRSHYSLLQKSKRFLRRKHLANLSGLHPCGGVNADAGCVSSKSPVQTWVTSASSGFSPYFSAEEGDGTRDWEEACVVIEADPIFNFLFHSPGFWAITRKNFTLG